MVKKILILMLAGLLGIAMPGHAQEKEANLKAAFIYNFTKYIDWDISEDNDFVIGVIGNSDVTNALNGIAKNNPVNNRKFIVRQYSRPEEIRFCNILFIPQHLQFPLHTILDKTGRGMLTVSEEEGYASQGTAFNFVIINDKLKFEANLKAIYSAGLKAGSQLLKLAIIVD